MDDISEYLEELAQLKVTYAYYKSLFNDLDDYISEIESKLWYLEDVLDNFYTINQNVYDESEGEMVDLFEDLAGCGYSDINNANEEIQSAYATLKLIRDQVEDKKEEYRKKVDEYVIPSDS